MRGSSPWVWERVRGVESGFRGVALWLARGPLKAGLAANIYGKNLLSIVY